MRRNLLAALALVLLGAALFAAVPTLAPTAFAQDATPEVADDAFAALHPVVERTRSLRNLKQLGLATHSFADSEFQKSGITSFPARYSVDENGKPLHSWRVFLLPFIGQDELYRQIRLDEPWDSEWNSQFHSKAPELFRRPGSSDPGCVYSCVVDETAVLQPAKKPGSQLGLAFAATTDGVSNTLLFVERKKPVCWMDPEADLTLDEFLADAADGSFGLSVLFADGRAVLLPKSLDSSLLKAYVTRAGGEVVPQPFAFVQNAKESPADAAESAADAAKQRSVFNLKQLALAAHNFIDSNGGAFPARCTVDANGAPLHSWRVFLLPFIEQNELYKQIRLDEPWDSEWNRQFHSKAPELFRRPGSSDPGCVYSCVVDKTAALQPATKPGVKIGVRIASFTDGVSNTVLFVERTKPVCWMDPEADLTLDEFLATVADAPDAVPAVFLDGRAALLPNSLAPNLLKAYVTRAGGEVVPQPSAFAQDANQPPAATVDAAKLRSVRNLKQLALAAQNFYDRHMSLPARCSVDADGKPLHSWRVFLLPFIEQNELYKQIRLDEPWDSEWNSQFHDKTPELFRRPGSSDPGCVYSCVADETAALQPAKEPGSQLGDRLGAFTDGLANTILFVERNDKTVCWMDPEADLTLDEFLANAADAPDAVLTVFADGRAVLLPNSLDPKLLKAYVTRAGGEVVPQPSAFAQDANQPPAATVDATADATADAAKLRSVRNLQQLALAAQNFYDRHMSLPARCSVDADGVPLHSWRVFLLPYIEQNELYKQIRLDEPWDSEWNSQFHSKAPELFRRPGSSDPGCVYSCVVDKTAALQPAKEPGSQLGFRLGAFFDGTMNTVLFVERKESVCWMDPNADLTLDEFLATVADAPDAVPAVFLDGRAALLPKSSEPSVLKAYVTRAGGEIVPVAPSVDAQDPKLAVQRKRSENNLKQLVLATHNFLDLNGGAFPARCTVDANGKPLHSWRVLLLPFIDEGELYKQIRLDEPWDSEHNRQFHSKTPAIFRRPGSSDPGCVYSCVVAPNAALQPATKPGVKTGVRIAEITDGASNTVLYVERTQPVCWMDPEADLTLDEFLATVAEGSVYRDATVVGMCDGRAQILSPAAKPKVLKGYVTRSGDVDLLP